MTMFWIILYLGAAGVVTYFCFKLGAATYKDGFDAGFTAGRTLANLPPIDLGLDDKPPVVKQERTQ